MPTSQQRKSLPRRSRGRPKLEDVAAIEQELLAVALKQFVRHGYGAASMTSIAKAAHVSKTTLYSRFASKENLFRAIIRTQIESVADMAGLDPQADHPDLAAGLKRFANRMLAVSLRDDLLEIDWLILSKSHRFPELGAAAAERTLFGIKQIADFIKECSAADGIPCKDPEGVAEAFILMIRGWFVNAMLTNRKLPPAQQEQWVERVVRVLLSDRNNW